jgi:CheY-like chemotaxis protein
MRSVSEGASCIPYANAAYTRFIWRCDVLEIDDAQPHQKILVVDNDRSLTRVLSIVLSSKGYTVQTAEDGLQGLAQIESWDPNLVISDFGMPRMNGLEFLVKIRSFPEIPVIIFSGQKGDHIKLEAMSGGANHFIKKPFEMREFQQQYLLN